MAMLFQNIRQGRAFPSGLQSEVISEGNIARIMANNGAFVMEALGKILGILEMNLIRKILIL